MPGGKSGDEAMEFSIEGNLLQDVAAIGLEGCAEIVNINAAEFCHHPVRDTRGEAPQPEIIDAHLAPSADDVVTSRNLFEEQRNVVGIVLKIAIHGDDVLATRVVESGGKACCLPKIPAQLDHGHAAVDGCDFAQHRERVVARSVVY